jgi:hypothetical protein
MIAARTLKQPPACGPFSELPHETLQLKAWPKI